MSEFTRYESDTAVGAELSLPFEKAGKAMTVSAVLIEHSDSDVATPYVYFKGCRDENNDVVYLTNTEKEALLGQFWQQVQNSNTDLISDETRKLSSEVLSLAQRYEEAIKSSGVVDAEVEWNSKESGVLQHEEFSITAMVYNNDIPAEKNNIDFYCTDSGLIKGADNIYDVALQVANVAEYERCKLLNQEKLQAYYAEHIHDIRNMDFRDMNDEQKDHMTFFVDCHKDVYGVRPYDDSHNECLRRYKWEQSRKEANIEKE